MAIERRKPKPGTIHHSGQEVVYNGSSYIELLGCNGIVPHQAQLGIKSGKAKVKF